MIEEIFNQAIQQAVHRVLTICESDEEGGIRYNGHIWTDQEDIYEELEPEFTETIIKDKKFMDELKEQEPDKEFQPSDSLTWSISDYLFMEIGIEIVNVFEIENGEI